MVTTRYDLSRSELAELLEGEPPYRIDQVWEGLHAQHREPSDLTNVPKALRSAIDELLPPALSLVREITSKNDRTVKQLWQLTDGRLVESVLMHYRDRATVCVSSQAGCAMACSFCATGQVGLDRHLTVGEIVEQVVKAAQRSGEQRLSNVVFMGMGEPLANFDQVWPAIERIHDDLGIGGDLNAQMLTSAHLDPATAEVGGDLEFVLVYRHRGASCQEHRWRSADQPGDFQWLI